MVERDLHFLCRALGIRQDPPVPIDGAVIRQRVWPAFKNAFKKGGLRRDMYPNNWNGNEFHAYCRYMTAIMTWAELRSWTTTEMETTIFAEYGRMPARWRCGCRHASPRGILYAEDR
jgi:hypothetical protein